MNIKSIFVVCSQIDWKAFDRLETVIEMSGIEHRAYVVKGHGASITFPTEVAPSIDAVKRFFSIANCDYRFGFNFSNTEGKFCTSVFMEEN